jgi:predicted DNA-binding protein (MmcQ/YjbR family)
MGPTPKVFQRADDALRAHALSYPETHEDHPWGETAIKVAKKKVFLFMGNDGESWGISTKLPDSGAIALTLPFAEPTGYGLGKSGWVSARFRAKDDIPLEMLKSWIDESYRAVAPAKLVKSLATRGEAPAPSKKPATKKPAAKKAATRKPAATKKPAAKKR